MGTKSFFYIVISLAALLGVAVIVLSFMNGQTVSFNLFGATTNIPLGAALSGAWISGLIGSAAVWQTKLADTRSEKKLEEWAAQDQKLAKEVASDTVKLLEAKIATLESALSKALEKKKS